MRTLGSSRRVLRRTRDSKVLITFRRVCMVIADRRLAPTQQPDYKAFNSISNNVDVPSLVQVQVNSFQWLKTDGLKDLL